MELERHECPIAGTAAFTGRLSHQDQHSLRLLAATGFIAASSRHLAFSIFVTVICPLTRSASNLTLSPTFTCLSMAGS